MRLLNKIYTLLWAFIGLTLSCLIGFSSLPFYAMKREWGQKFHHAFGRVGLWCMGIKVEYIGLENLPQNGGAILAPNHESFFDILVLASVPYDFSWLSKEENGKIPGIGHAMRAMGCYFVKRDRSEHDANVMGDVEQGLISGRSVIIFPEGTRTRTGELLPFKKGAFRTAKQTGAPIIPIALTGTRDIAKPGELPTRGHRVTARFGKPFFVAKEAELPQTMKNFKEVLTNLLSLDRPLR